MLQDELENHDGVSKGKYTIGLGQDSMAFCTEVEDVISMRYAYSYVEKHHWCGRVVCPTRLKSYSYAFSENMCNIVFVILKTNVTLKCPIRAL